MRIDGRMWSVLPTAALIGTLSGSLAQADILAVTNLDDDGPGSLRQTIANASPGDTILFAVVGTIVLTGGDLVIDKNLVIQGLGQELIGVSGGGSSRVLDIVAGNVSISDLTIHDDDSSQEGGGIRNQGVLTLRHVMIERNMAENGGGVWNTGR